MNGIGKEARKMAVRKSSKKSQPADRQRKSVGARVKSMVSRTAGQKKKKKSVKKAVASDRLVEKPMSKGFQAVSERLPLKVLRSIKKRAAAKGVAIEAHMAHVLERAWRRNIR